MTEKYLEAYNDVFADIVNVLLFHGERRMSPKQLISSHVQSVYKADDGLHEEERDVFKYWKKGNIRVAICGIENQTAEHPYMPLRIMGYDGAAYREQLLRESQQKKYPVITMVLHFGTKKRWSKPLRLSECLDIPSELRAYVSDYTINVFDIAFLPDEVIAQFTSDFRIVADYFSQMRKNKSYTPSGEKIRHVDAVLKLMAVMTKDERFVEAQHMKNGEVRNMCEVLDRVEQRGIEKGHAAGMMEGMAQGRLLLADAIRRLNAGENAEQLLAAGMDADTVELALTFQLPLNR